MQDKDLNVFAENANQSSFKLKDFVFRYIKYLPLIVLSIIISYIAAKIKILYSQEKFQSSGKLFIKDEKQSYGGEKNVEDLFTEKGGNDLNTEMELLKSRYLMKRVVKKMGLQNKLYNKGKVKTTLVYQNQPIKLSVYGNPDSVGSAQLNIKVLDDNFFQLATDKRKVKFGEEFPFAEKMLKIDRTSYFNKANYGIDYIIEFMNLEAAAGQYAGSIKVGQVGDFTRLLELVAKTDNPNLSADLVNTLITEYIANNLEENKVVAKFTKEFIDDRVDSLEGEVERIETNLRRFREQSNAINLDNQSQVYLANLNKINEELSKQRLFLGKAQLLLKFFKDDKDATGYAPIGINLGDNNLENLMLDFNQKQLKRKNMQEVVELGNLDYQEIVSDLKRLRSSVIQGLERLIGAGETEAGFLEKDRADNIGKLDNIPYLQKELLNYDRNRKIKEELYLFLKKKGEEAGITSVQTLSNSKQIDEALPNFNPVEPVRKTTYTMFLFLGILIPALLAYVLEVFNDKIRYRDDIQKQTRTPILAEVGHNDEGQTLVVKAKSRKVIAEQFRMIRTNIQYLVGNKEKFTILVTSTFSGEGKSFISTNVAAAIALTGKKTVILEFDLRKPKVLAGLNMTKSAGITNYLVGKVKIEDAIRPVPGIDNMYVMACGAIPPNPAELLLEDSVTKMFEYLQQNFDAVIIDSAPVGLVTDSMTLSKFADSTLYIVRHKYTLKKQIKLIDELYTQQKLPKLSIVINDVIGSTGGYYGYGGYGYGYGKGAYGYGSGYFEDKQKSFLSDAWKKVKQFFVFWK
jgi:tyrosine-protein kinase Etk/Wzc